MLMFITPASAELNDPTRPVDYVNGSQGSAKAEKGGLRVSSIIIGKNRRTAIIDGQSVQKGDSVRGMKVIAINPAEVLLKSNNKQLQVSLLPEKVKKPVSRKELQSEHN
ncbi:MAG: MSHA biogenesis protein MshK [Gammaproteobacteria bacterium]|nr:MSHA biogenesis protein MshK [Gammaproteobacteria bacterium]